MSDVDPETAASKPPEPPVLPVPFANSTAAPVAVPIISVETTAPVLPPVRPAVPAANSATTRAGTVEPRVASEAAGFVPLRTEPPPRLLATWWLRYLLLLTMTVGIAVVVMAEYAIGPGGLVEAPPVIIAHVLAATLLVGWTVCALVDADRLVPATRYHRGSSWTLAAVLWIVAFASAIGFVGVLSRARTRFDDPDGDVRAVAVTAIAAAVTLVLVWLPFGYLAGQARRVGAPRRVFILWFAGSMFAAVGTASIALMGLHDMLADRGMTAAERALQTAVVYGVPAVVFALSTWRATTVFDEVVDLRWRRWRTEWEMTLLEFAAQPVPGPELADASDAAADD